jgi:transmembrane sensor
MSDQQIFDLFHHYLHGTCTPDELQTALELLHTQQGKKHWQKLLNEQAEIAQHQDIPAINITVSNSIWQKLAANIGTEPEAIQLPSRRHTWFSAAHLAVACSILFLLGVGAWRWQVFYHSVQNIHVQTAFGEKKRIGLPDGSVIILNGNSTIDARFPQNTDLPREIYLSGEAFFTVTKQPNQRSFRVVTPDSCVVEVLGTEFNVNQRGTGTKIVLETGKIALTIPQKSNPSKKITLQPQEMVAISPNHAAVALQKSNTHLFTSWKNNQLILDNTPLSEISDMLKNTYNISLILPNPQLSKERMSGTIASGNIDDLLRALAYSLKLEVFREGNEVVFKKDTK